MMKYAMGKKTKELDETLLLISENMKMNTKLWHKVKQIEISFVVINLKPLLLI